jgi:hypothetical protein
MTALQLGSTRPGRLVLLAVGIAALLLGAAAQSLPAVPPDRISLAPADSLDILSTDDGSTLIGSITGIGPDSIEFQTDIGRITIGTSRIVEVRRVHRSTVRKGKYWYPDPNPTRLYLFPTGRMLPRGSGYFADYYIFFAAAGYALTDWFTISGGASLFPGLSPIDQIYYLGPKFRVASGGKFQAAVAALLVNIPDFGDDDENPLIGLVAPVVTYGGPGGGITVGAGYGFAGDEFADKPLVLVGLDRRITRRMALVSENWVLPGTDHPVVSYGLRFFGESLSVDLGFFNVISGDAIFPGLPFVAFVVNF